MGTFIAAYSIVWIAVTLYVVRLGVTQRRQRIEFDALRSQIEQNENGPYPLSKAA